MPPSLESLGLDRLSRAERLALVQDLWDSIANEGSPLPMSEARRNELERRADDDDTAPDEELIPWEQVKAQARARFRP